MKSLKTGCLITLFLTAALLLPAEDAGTIRGVKEICSAFLKQVMVDDYNGAFAYLKAQPNSISGENFAELEVLAIQQAPTIREVYGEAIDVRLVKEDLTSDFLLRLVYVIRRERHIIRWEFIYYKPAAVWKLDAVSFDDKIDGLF
jgi:hypothetical protein